MSFRYPGVNRDRFTPVSVPFRRRVGHEVELHSGGPLFVRLGTERGLLVPSPPNRWNPPGQTPGLHSYGCRCRAANRYPIHPTHDSSARGGEHIIGGNNGVLFSSPAYMTAISSLAELVRESGASGSMSTGGHTHVSISGLTLLKAVNLFRNLEVLWEEILGLAAGPWDEVRRNGCMSAPRPGNPLARVYSGGYYGLRAGSVWDIAPSEVTQINAITSAFRFTLQERVRRKTIEFRVWNTLTSKWRLFLAGGVSAALVEAAVQGRTLDRDSNVTLIEHLDGLLTPDLIVLIERQKAIQSGGIGFAA